MRLENVLDHYNERDRDGKEEQHQEPNVEKFNLETSRDEILELIASFNEAPFTIQRICELLCSPFKYYDRISTFLRGLEKNLRVISSNNWPKSYVDLASNDKVTSNNKPEPQEQPQEPLQPQLPQQASEPEESANNSISMPP